MPIPHDVVARSIDNNSVQVIWPNLLAESPYIQGYKLYRRATTIGGKPVDSLKLLTGQMIGPLANSYEDNTTKEGMVYYYSLKTVADDQVTMSSPSQEAGITLLVTVINGVANVRIFPSGKTVFIKWDNPMGDEIKSIKIIRSTEGKDGVEEIAVLAATVQAFADTKIANGSTYYYQLQVENMVGKKSRLSDAVGVKIY